MQLNRSHLSIETVRISRREVLRLAVVAGAGLTGALVIGCGGEEEVEKVAVGNEEVKALTLAAAADLVRRKKVSPVDLVEAYLARIERLDPLLNAYITVAAEQALAAARRAEDDVVSGKDLGPLHGVPLAIKDLFPTKGLRTTAGSKILADWVPDEDAHVVGRLREAGAIILGKLNLHEWATGGTTINPYFGTTLNPWDTSRITGGSSGGSGAAVAAALCAGSIGTDTGGSVRSPASMCGIVGLMPTYGLVSLRGVIPLSQSFDHVGPMTRTVEDAAIMLETMAGYDPEDPGSVDRPVRAYREAIAGDVRGLRLGLPKNYFFEEADPEVVAAVREAAARLEGEGAQVVDVDVPGMEGFLDIWLPIVVSEAAANQAENLKERPGDFGEDVLTALRYGQTITTADYDKAQLARAEFQQGLAALFVDIDVLLTATMPTTALTIEEAQPPNFDLFFHGRFMAPFNMAEHPALSVPSGLSQEGLPMSLQIIGGPFEEATVLRVGAAHERASGWIGRLPPGI